VVVNTPTGNISTGALVTITWTINGDAPTIAGSLKIRNKATNEDTTIDEALDLSKSSKQWKVSVQPGQYIFVINDGSGEKFSGNFNVVNGVPLSDAPSDPTDGAPTSPAATPASPAAAPASPATPAGNSPATAPSSAAKPPSSGAPNGNPPAVSSSGSNPAKSIGPTTSATT
ncbi:20933_t:CDS:1, partial [Dentiscutata erythropus]